MFTKFHLTASVQQGNKLRRMALEYRKGSRHHSSWWSFHFRRSFRLSSNHSFGSESGRRLSKECTKEVGASSGRSSIPGRERSDVLLERTRPSHKKYATGVFPGRCGGHTYVRPTSLCGDDWETGFDSREVSGTTSFSRIHVIRPAKLHRIGICVPKTPGLRRYKSQTTDAIVSDSSAIPFPGRCRSAKVLHTGGSLPDKIHTFPHRDSVYPRRQLVETNHNQPLSRNKHELPSV